MKLEFKKYGLLTFLVVCFLSLASSFSSLVKAEDNANIEVEGLPKPYDAVSLLSFSFGREVEFPQILSSSDVNSYRQIFKFQKKVIGRKLAD